MFCMLRLSAEAIGVDDRLFMYHFMRDADDHLGVDWSEDASRKLKRLGELSFHNGDAFCLRGQYILSLLHYLYHK